jgi:hypothetical protein
MADIVSGLFGLSPYETVQQQQNQVDKSAASFAQMNAAQRGAMGLFQGGAGIAREAGGMMGLPNPQVAEAQVRQAALQGLDISSPESILQRAQQVQDPKLKMQLMLIAREAQAKQQQMASEAAKVKLAERKQDFQENEALQLKKDQLEAKKAQDLRDDEFKRWQVKMMQEGRIQALQLAASLKASGQAQQPTKLSPTAQKELFESDEAVMGATAGVKALQQALDINNNAMGGKGAGVLADIGSVLPDAIRPEAFDATQELDNIIQNSVLPQMKSIFGANPTEGERKILLDIAGSSSKPAKVREGIFTRAMTAAETRRKFNEKKASELRGGTYFAPKGAEAPTETKGTPAAVEEWERGPDGKMRRKQ